MNKVRSGLLAIALLFITGCATSKIETVRETAWDEETVAYKKDKISSTQAYEIRNFRFADNQFKGDVVTVTTTRYKNYTLRTAPVYKEKYSTPYKPRFGDPLEQLLNLPFAILSGVVQMDLNATRDWMNYEDSRSKRLVSRKCVDHETRTGSSSYRNERSEAKASSCNISIFANELIFIGRQSRVGLVTDSFGHFSCRMSSPPYFATKKETEPYYLELLTAIALPDAYLNGLRNNPPSIFPKNVSVKAVTKSAGYSIASDSATTSPRLYFVDLKSFGNEVNRVVQAALKCTCNDASIAVGNVTLRRYQDTRKDLIKVFNAMVSEVIQASNTKVTTPDHVKNVVAAYSVSTHQTADSLLASLTRTLSSVESYLKVANMLETKNEDQHRYERELLWNRSKLAGANNDVDRRIWERKVASKESTLAAIKKDIVALQSRMQVSGLDIHSLKDMQEQTKDDYTALKGMHDAYLSAMKAVFDVGVTSPHLRSGKLLFMRMSLGKAIEYALSCPEYLSSRQEKKIYLLWNSTKGEFR